MQVQFPSTFTLQTAVAKVTEDIDEDNEEIQSEVVKKIGEANASATLAVGSAQGHVMKLEAAAWRKFGDAALVQKVVDTLPALAEEMGKPLASTTEGIFISNGEPSGSEDLEEYDFDYGSGTLLEREVILDLANSMR